MYPKTKPIETSKLNALEPLYYKRIKIKLRWRIHSEPVYHLLTSGLAEISTFWRVGGPCWFTCTLRLHILTVHPLCAVPLGPFWYRSPHRVCPWRERNCEGVQAHKSAETFKRTAQCKDCCQQPPLTSGSVRSNYDTRAGNKLTNWTIEGGRSVV